MGTFYLFYEGYHIFLPQMVEQFLHRRVALKCCGRAHHQQLSFGSGDGYVEAAPVLQQIS